MHPTLAAALSRVMTGVGLRRAEAAALVPLVATDLPDLMAVGRLAASGGTSRPFTCGIVNAKSGRCQENCTFCAQSARHRTGTPEYPLLDEDELLRRAERMEREGVDCLGLVTSGTGPTDRDLEHLCRVGERIAASFRVRLCASLGVLDGERARQLRAAGFSRYHHNLETAASHYPAVCTSHPYQMRVDTVRAVRDAGLQTCCGGIFGVGESWDQRLELSATLQDLDVDSIPINFLTPIAGTALADTPVLPPAEGLAIIAIFRLMHPGRDIVVCGGRTNCLGRIDSLVFAAGANAVLTGDYLTTPGSAVAADRELMHTLGLR